MEKNKSVQFPDSSSSPQKASNYDELLMQHSLLFTDSLKDMRELRKQLYSAAEYFEASYDREEVHKQIVVETLKDYISKAMVSTVDHLGSVAYKVNNFLNDEVLEFSSTNLRFCCLEQKMRGCKEYMDRNGMLQQSLILTFPKYHKHYILPSKGETIKLVQENCISNPNDLQPSLKVDPGAKMEKLPSVVRKGIVSSKDAQVGPVTFAFAKTSNNKQLERRASSPLRFPLKRSGSVNRSISPMPNSSKQWTPASEPPSSASMRKPAERDKTKEIQLYSKRSRNLFRALLSMRKEK
ncbi:protein ABIL3-like isoform X2 [Impatiens glandulifera]|uniref:protein ABIL3-like isoform X2 n=1 Tax=Impatiens glandulifera TaxID=253017 RepID=UPI001FB06E43|nr:protein ABIL3-like isoform X2 [Impatiens glandulifera]